MLRGARKRWRRRSGEAYRSQPAILALFAQAGANLQLTAESVHELLASWPEERGLHAKVASCEQEGDEITHDIIRTLYQAHLSPFERGRIHALAEALDDVVDDLEEVSEELAMYAIEAPMEQAQELASVARDAGRSLRRALEKFRDAEEFGPEAIEVRKLERDGDRIYRQALASLFEGGIDPTGNPLEGRLRGPRGRHRSGPPGDGHPQRASAQIVPRPRAPGVAYEEAGLDPVAGGIVGRSERRRRSLRSRVRDGSSVSSRP